MDHLFLKKLKEGCNIGIKREFKTIQLPSGFTYPQSFIEFIERKPPPDLKPWWFLHKYPCTSESWLKTVREQYPDRQLVPFAKVDHTDDVVCFDASRPSSDPIVHYVHTYASPGWEDRGHALNFDAWLNTAKADAQQLKAADEPE